MTSQNWQNISAGPRQVKDLQKAIGHLTWEGKTFTEVTGVVGGDEHRSSYTIPIGGGVRPEVVALDEEIRIKYGHEITKANVRAIIADYEAALPEAVKSRPVDDKRRTPDEDAEIKAKVAEREAGYQAKRDAELALLAQVVAKAPAGAKALIVAEYCQDASDSQSDYWASHAVRTVAIGFRLTAREDFKALRAAAAQFPETASVEFTEHRDNYSMGAGNYLSDHGGAHAGTGWLVRSSSMSSQWVNLTEDAIPAAPATPASPTVSAGNGAVTVSPVAGRPGVVEIRFADKPPVEVRKALKSHHFGWSNQDGVWRGRDAEFAESLAQRS